ncbi:MAG: hypothetical protein J5851_01485, partial [Oscillospiraceae bacterium]|nr:hypothetical protein [Oscillospiraceae bacterium]
VIASNKAESASGGGIYVFGNGMTSQNTFKLNNIEFTNNTAGENGGAINMDTCTPNMCASGCTFKSNHAGKNGGAINRDKSRVGTSYEFYVTNGTFDSNWAFGGTGGAINDATGCPVKVTTSVFTFNQCHGNGGAINAGTVEVTDSEFEHNKSMGNGGAIRGYQNSCVYENIVKGSNFKFNSAALGGGALYFGTFHDTLIEDCTIADNSASNGGGITNHGCMIVKNCEIYGNSASDCGGGIYLGEKAEMDYKMRCTHLTVSGGNIYRNSAKRGTVLYYVSGSDYKFVDGAQYNGSIY